MFRTNLMIQLRAPTWELLNQIKQKKSLKTLEQLQMDIIVQDYAKPVIMLIQRAFNPTETNVDALLIKWADHDFQLKARELRNRLNSFAKKAGHSIHHRMKEIDDEIEDLISRSLRTCWFKVDKNKFDEGPLVVCYPKQVERNLLAKQVFDPSEFNEPLLVSSNGDFSFHVDNQLSQNLFEQDSDQDESMDPIEIIAVTGGSEEP